MYVFAIILYNLITMIQDLFYGYFTHITLIKYKLLFILEDPCGPNIVNFNLGKSPLEPWYYFTTHFFRDLFIYLISLNQCQGWCHQTMLIHLIQDIAKAEDDYDDCI